MKKLLILLVVLSMLLASCDWNLDDNRDRDLNGVTVDNNNCGANACTEYESDPIGEVDIYDGKGNSIYLHTDNTSSGESYEVQPQNVCITNCGSYMDVATVEAPTQ